MIDFSKIKTLYVDGKEVKTFSVDGHEAWRPPSLLPDPIWFQNDALERKRLSMSWTGTNDIESSTDGETWSDYAGSTTLTVQPSGGRVYFRHKPNGSYSGFKQPVPSLVDVGHWSVGGDIASLVPAGYDGDQLEDYIFANMFQNQADLYDASQLSLTLMAHDRTYDWMFTECYNLSAAPVLPRTDLSADCYVIMFMNCSNLTSAPYLPAQDASPENCYYQMFAGCSKLREISCELTSWGGGTYNWVEGVSSDGTFYCPAALGDGSTIDRGGWRCPTGWTVVNH